MRKLALLAAAALLSATAAYAADINSLIQNAQLRALPPGTKTIDFRLADLDGATVSLSSFKGHVVVLNFWASWCAPCRSEMGSLEALYRRYKSQGLVVLGVNLQEGPSRVKSYVRQAGLTFPILLDTTGRVAVTYGARGLPTTYVIDKRGEITSGIMGAHEWDTPQVRRLMQALIDAG